MPGEAEGGCGVIGLASAEKIAGKHLLKALKQMCNRGNGKGGGIAVAGLSHEQLNVSDEVLKNDYLLAIAYLDHSCKKELEEKFIHPHFIIDAERPVAHLSDYKNLEIKPPEVVLYFVRLKTTQPDEDQFVYENSYRLNRHFYSVQGEKRAFVLSHGKDLLVLKLVGFADDVIEYYQLEQFQAHVWIGHHRYPTKGKVWHPGGAHPFVGMNEALVHNGDFANYYSIAEYLAQRDTHPLFMTDTEVSVLLFDLYLRQYRYPLEYVIEAFAPTTERDFNLLPQERQQIYEQIQKTHLSASPDGPWFFLIAQSLQNSSGGRDYSLIGITDTSMLRPQVFALQNGRAPIGIAASEKQAIDAALESLSESSDYWPTADYYWNARGGSASDGGAFIFKVSSDKNFQVLNKFDQQIYDQPLNAPSPSLEAVQPNDHFPDLDHHALFEWAKQRLSKWSYEEFASFLKGINQRYGKKDPDLAIALQTALLDIRLPIGSLRRSSYQSILNQTLKELFSSLAEQTQFKVIDAAPFDSEGPNSLAQHIIKLYREGIQKFIIFNCKGQRFIGNGLGSDSEKVEIHVYGSSGDYLASGIDGAKIFVHGSAQDQVAQIMKEGTLVVYGDVGQTFMYGAKGGKAFIRGNAAGRPLINAVGKPRVVVNGTCLDYLAESFMAGNPHQGGGFVIVNGIYLDDQGKVVEMPTPYPGNNLFSLASGGAIFLRDPDQQVTLDQLNGGEFSEMTEADWQLILPYLEENEHYFKIPVTQLLTHHGKHLDYSQVYRKVVPVIIHALQGEEAWVKGKD